MLPWNHALPIDRQKGAAARAAIALAAFWGGGAAGCWLLREEGGEEMPWKLRGKPLEGP